MQSWLKIFNSLVNKFNGVNFFALLAAVLFGLLMYERHESAEVRRLNRAIQNDLIAAQSEVRLYQEQAVTRGALLFDTEHDLKRAIAKNETLQTRVKDVERALKVIGLRLQGLTAVQIAAPAVRETVSVVVEPQAERILFSDTIGGILVSGEYQYPSDVISLETEVPPFELDVTTTRNKYGFWAVTVESESPWFKPRNVRHYIHDDYKSVSDVPWLQRNFGLWGFYRWPGDMGLRGGATKWLIQPFFEVVSDAVKMRAYGSFGVSVRLFGGK